MKQMTPFQKLKFTIDRIGLQYVPSNDNQTVTGQTVYQYTKSKQIQQEQQRVPYFKTQGHHQQAFKQHSSQFRLQQIQQLKHVYQNQQKNLISQINTLNNKIIQLQLKYQSKCSQNQRLLSQLKSKNQQNSQLRACILEVQQKNARKLSQSGVLDRQRKLKQEIDRINITVMDLAKDLNQQKTNRKNIQKQYEQYKLQYNQMEQSFNLQKTQLKKQLILLQQELQKRAELLEHSIKSSRDQKISHKAEISDLKQKHQYKAGLLQEQIGNLKQDVYNLKNEITELKFTINNLQKQNQTQSRSNMNLSNQLSSTKIILSQSQQTIKLLTQKVQQQKLQLVYYQQQLQEQRSNLKVKVVQVRDESLEMQLSMYKKQCKQLLKQKSILQSVCKDKSQYTIIQENHITINKNY